MQKVRSNSNPTGFQNLRDVTVLWHGWLKKLGRFSKRWRRRYFVFVSTANGTKELRHYDTCRDVPSLLVSTPKGVISLTDAIGICCFLPTSPHTAKKPAKFNRSDGNDAGLETHDQRFAVVTPLVCIAVVQMVVCECVCMTMAALLPVIVTACDAPGVPQWPRMGKVSDSTQCLSYVRKLIWAHCDSAARLFSASESQQGLSLLAALSAFYPAIDVLHSGWMTKKRERTGHSPKSIISYWKRHFFVFLATGDLLYFRDDSLNELQGRVDVRHAPTVRVTGERIIEEKKKESLFKFASKLSALERQTCLVWIATPPSKMFVLMLQDEHEGAAATGGSKRQELTPAAKKWLSLLLKGHAETKYTQLEKCVAAGKYENTPEIISAIRAGIPDELRGQLWKGFSGASELQRRAELKRSIRKATKITNFRQLSSSKVSSLAEPATLFEEYAAPIDSEDPESPENQMLFGRLRALALHETQHADADMTLQSARLTRAESDSSVYNERPSEFGDPRGSFLLQQSMETDEDTEDDEAAVGGNSATGDSSRNTLKQLVKGRLGDYVYPSDAPSADWELSARRRVLIANSRYNPFSHPCPWRVSCLLLAYLEEESAFWVINSLMDAILPGYFHGHRPALQVDVAAFQSLLEDRAPALFSHLRALDFPVDRLVEKWFLSIFTSSAIPLPTVLRIWDAFFSQGLRILFGVGIALFLLAEEKLFHAKSSSEVEELLRATESSCIDANALFSLVFKDDLNISWLTGDQLEKLRSTHRLRVLDVVSQNVEHFNEKLGILTQIEDICARCSLVTQRLLSSKSSDAASQAEDKELWLSPPDAVDDLDGYSMDSCFHMLLMHLRTLIDGASELATELGLRQSKWLALSSQLKSCPLGKLPSLDLQSWLSQVREGKISGAGYDSSYSTESEKLAYLTVTEMVDASDMFFECSGSRVTMSGGGGWSCLMNTREDLKPSHSFLSEVFMYSLVLTVKALCASRLECLSASYRFMWHGGRWIQSPIEYSMLQQKQQQVDSTTPQRDARRLERSNTNATFAPAGTRLKPRTCDDSELLRHTIVEDPRTRRVTGNSKSSNMMAKRRGYSGADFVSQDDDEPVVMTMPLSPAIGGRTDRNSFHFFQGYTQQGGSGPIILDVSDNGISNNAWSGSGSGGNSQFGMPSKRKLDDLAFQYKQGGEIFHLAHGKFMACFSTYIRLENRIRGWALKERAFVLEEDLQQEMKDMESEIQGSQWIGQF